MTSFLEYLGDRFSDTDNYLAKSTGFLTGIGTMIYFGFDMDNIILLFSWAALINTFLVFATSAITTIVVLIATDIYKYAKPKTLTFIKAKFFIIKVKLSKHGKQKDSNERAA